MFLRKSNSDNERKPKCMFSKGPYPAYNRDVMDNQKWFESTIYCVLIVSPITKVLLKEYRHHTTGLFNSYICGQLTLQQVPSCKQMILCEQEKNNEQITEATTPTGKFITPTAHCKASEMIPTCLLETVVALITSGGIRKYVLLMRVYSAHFYPRILSRYCTKDELLMYNTQYQHIMIQAELYLRGW